MTLAIRSPGFLSPSVAAFFFENHLLWWAVLALLGLIIVLVAIKRLDRRLRLAGISLLVATILWSLLAFITDTPAERLYAAHLALGQAAETHDIDAILNLCEPHFSLRFSEISPNIEEAKKEIKGYMDSLNVKDTTITRYAVTFSPNDVATTDFTALTRSDATPLQTTWRVTWVDLPGEDWRIRMAQGHFTQH